MVPTCRPPLCPPTLTCFIPPALSVRPVPPTSTRRLPTLRATPLRAPSTLSTRVSNLSMPPALSLHVLPAFVRTPYPFTRASPRPAPLPTLLCLHPCVPALIGASRTSAFGLTPRPTVIPHPVPMPRAVATRPCPLSPARPASTLPGPLSRVPAPDHAGRHGRIPAPTDVPRRPTDVYRRDRRPPTC